MTARTDQNNNKRTPQINRDKITCCIPPNLFSWDNSPLFTSSASDSASGSEWVRLHATDTQTLISVLTLVSDLGILFFGVQLLS